MVVDDIKLQPHAGFWIKKIYQSENTTEESYSLRFFVKLVEQYKLIVEYLNYFL